MHTIQLSPEQLPEFTQLFPEIHRLKTASEYEFGRYKIGRALVVIYNSGKVVFSEKPEGEMRNKIIEFIASRDGFDGPVIGSDEAGKGELLGPMVVAAVLLRTPEDRALARFCGVMDSKELSRGQLAEVSRIARTYPYAVRVLSPRDFNEKFRSGNLNDLLTEMHASAISKLLEKIDTNEKCTVIIDKFGSKRNDLKLEEALKQAHLNINIITTTRAERFESVAAASIIAKSEYEKWLASYETSEKINIRKLTKDKIAVHRKRNEFCKVSYLTGYKEGKSIG
ncbi:MAG: hypothetical protein QW500_03245 [Candidatus Micrarchaeia archaeon]